MVTCDFAFICNKVKNKKVLKLREMFKRTKPVLCELCTVVYALKMFATRYRGLPYKIKVRWTP